MDSTNRFNPMDFPAALSVPERLSCESAWVGHLPFAFALVQMCRPDVLVELGAAHGDSYCAFCQAIAALSLPTRCTAIDTWAGDAHTGDYGEVLNDLRAHHDPRYGKFSRLLQSTFDDALKDFADGSIDLLHIDGLHTYDAVKHDFETWQPKLSKCAVVIFHDTMVLHKDFGVWRFWNELAGKFPSFGFRHSAGLGVLAVGTDAPPALLYFIEVAKTHREEVQQYFERLGQGVDAISKTSMMSAHCYEMHVSLNERRTQLRQQIVPANIQTAMRKPVGYMRDMLRLVREAIGDDLRNRGLAVPAPAKHVAPPDDESHAGI